MTQRNNFTLTQTDDGGTITKGGPDGETITKGGPEDEAPVSATGLFAPAPTPKQPKPEELKAEARKHVLNAKFNRFARHG